MPLKETRSQIRVLPVHATHAQLSVLIPLSPNGVVVLKGPRQAEREGWGCVQGGVAKFRGRGGTIRRRGPDGGA